jgi:nitrogen fixation NifU-like protein
MDLYQKEILKLAANAMAHGSLEDLKSNLNNHHKIKASDSDSFCEKSYLSYTHRNPLCGDKITLHILLEDHKISALAHETEACVLCQASASILGENFKGMTLEEALKITQYLKKNLENDSLKHKTKELKDKWKNLSIFQPVSIHKNRHTCVMLPFEALVKALSP